MSDKTWKQAERDVSAYFGGERTPLSGGNSKQTRADVIHDELFVEVKYRKKHAVIGLWDATHALAKKEQKIPVVCLRERGRPGFWIVVHSDDLCEVGLARQAATEPPKEGVA